MALTYRSLLIIISLSIILAMKMTRNNIARCSNDFECKECMVEDTYKKCTQNTCYCCSLDNKCVYQNR